MSSLAIILFNSIFVKNVVLTQFLGICSFLGVSRDSKSALGMGEAVIVVMMVASAITWPIQHFILDPYGLGYLQTVIFILVIASVVQMIEAFMKRAVPSLYQALGIYLPLITTNCAILGVAIINITDEYTFLEAMVNSFGTGVGYALAIWMFSAVRSKINEDAVPEALRGLPIVLVASSIVALAFIGFAGVAEGLFAGGQTVLPFLS